MGRLQLKNVTAKKGLLYFRRKLNGRDTYIRFPAIDDPDFAAEYARLTTPEPERARPAEGTFAALVEAFRASPEFWALGSNTRTNQQHYLDLIVVQMGARSGKGLRPTHVYALRDRMAETPGKANAWLSVMRSLLSYATRLDMRGDNPASGIKLLAVASTSRGPQTFCEPALT